MNDSTATTTVLLQGEMKNYRKSRKTQDFLLKSSDRTGAGATAVAAALAGLSGEAVGLASMSGVQEEADFVEFDLNGEPVKAWLTWSPFKDGDQVEVVAERAENNSWRAFGIARADHVVALYPHCSRGRKAHYKATIRWWLIVTAIIVLASAIIMTSIVLIEKSYMSMAMVFTLIFGGGGGFFLVTAPIALSISRKYMPSVRMAEGIFAGFGWKNVESIDLPAISKKNRQPSDTSGMGSLYFRY